MKPSLYMALTLLATFKAFAAPSYTITDLGTLGWAIPEPEPGPIPNTTVYDQTSDGQVGILLVQSQTTSPAAHAYLYKTGTLTDLGVLPGASENAGPPTSMAVSLNKVAHVVGSSDSAFSGPRGNSLVHAVLWNGTPTDLGTIQGSPNFTSMAEAINDSEEIVGSSEVSLTAGGTSTRAFVWVSGKMYNLTFYTNNQNFVLTNATAIDCQGQIAAIGYLANDPTQAQHSFVLNRVGPARPTCH